MPRENKHFHFGRRLSALSSCISSLTFPPSCSFFSIHSFFILHLFLEPLLRAWCVGNTGRHLRTKTPALVTRTFFILLCDLLFFTYTGLRCFSEISSKNVFFYTGHVIFHLHRGCDVFNITQTPNSAISHFPARIDNCVTNISYINLGAQLSLLP